MYLIILFLFCTSVVTLGQSITANESNGTQLKYIKTYPNPATTTVNIEFQKGYNRFYSLLILNSLGKKMYLAKFIPTTFIIDLRTEKFYRGIYIYQLLDRTGAVVESGKILVVN